MSTVTRMRLRSDDDMVALARVVDLVEPGSPARRSVSRPAVRPAPPAPSRPSSLRRALGALTPWLMVTLGAAWFVFGPWLLGVRGGR